MRQCSPYELLGPRGCLLLLPLSCGGGSGVPVLLLRHRAPPSTGVPSKMRREPSASPEIILPSGRAWRR
jgi:hypothetical protein